MFQKILFATCLREACDHAARMAFDLAQKYDAHLYVFNVFGMPTHGYSQVVTDLITGDEVVLNEEYVDWVKEEIAEYCNQLLKKTKKYSFEVTIGFPHREILRFARLIDPDLIIMGGSTGDPEVSTYKRSIAGSTVQRVAKAAPCPVLVVGYPLPAFWGEYSNVVFGTDFSNASDAGFEFALRLLREQKLDCELHVFHALSDGVIQTGDTNAQEEIRDHIGKTKQQIKQKYDPWMEGLKQYFVEVRKGLPALEILKYADEKHADLIVLGPHTKKWEIIAKDHTSIFEQVIARSRCPVVSVNRFAQGKQD